MRFRCQSLMLCSHVSSGSAASYSCCPTWVVTPADQVGSSQPLMVAQGHPANSFCSDLCCQHRVALSHLALQVQWGRKEPPTAQKGPTVQQGERPAFIWDPDQPSRSLPLPNHCSGTQGQVHKLCLPLTPSKRRGPSSPGSEKTPILLCSKKTSNMHDTAFPSPA